MGLTGRRRLKEDGFWYIFICAKASGSELTHYVILVYWAPQLLSCNCTDLRLECGLHKKDVAAVMTPPMQLPLFFMSALRLSSDPRGCPPCGVRHSVSLWTYRAAYEAM